MQYRVSFVIRTLAHFVICGIEFLGLAVLFQRFGQIDGWSLAEVGLFYGMIAIAFAIAEGVVRGFDVTLCFWTVESLEIVNCATYGGVGAGQFPLTIYRPWFRHIFTFLIPLATINYFPAHAILGRVDSLGSTPLMQWLSPCAGLVFLLASLRVWRVGVQRYTSTGS